MSRLFFFVLAFGISSCGGITVEQPKPTKVDSTTETPPPDDYGTIGGNLPPETPAPNNTETDKKKKKDIGATIDTSCKSVLPPGVMDMAIQKNGDFYDTHGTFDLRARVALGDEDAGERRMYGNGVRLWVRVPEVIQVTKGRGSNKAEVCLTVGNVNCRYIWGAKVFELDACDFDVRPSDIIGASFFALQVNSKPDADDAMVVAKLGLLSDSL